MITILAIYHAVSIRRPDKHLVYSLASAFEMIYSPAINVPMFIWSLPVAVPFFIFRSTVSTSQGIISGTSFGSVWIVVLLSRSWISLPCLFRCVINLSWSSVYDRLSYDTLVVFPGKTILNPIIPSSLRIAPVIVRQPGEN